MPFNKGDFTQQGVAGHVNANLRLNEKRLVNIDLTSNEEAEGCTIAGTVTDLLNDKVYPIGSGVSGNIEITENGENINVAPYATATVNVAGGGSDMRVCHITAINATGANAAIPLAAAKPVYNEVYINENMPLVQSGTTINVDFIIAYDEFELGYFVGFYNPDDGVGTWALTDLVNCSLSDDLISVTDPSQDCSFTLTYTGE